MLTNRIEKDPVNKFEPLKRERGNIVDVKWETNERLRINITINFIECEIMKETEEILKKYKKNIYYLPYKHTCIGVPKIINFEFNKSAKMNPINYLSNNIFLSTQTDIFSKKKKRKILKRISPVSQMQLILLYKKKKISNTL